MTAPELSADEQATVERFEAAEEPEEIRVERVALAIQASRETFPPPWDHLSERTRDHYRKQARAAIAALDLP